MSEELIVEIDADLADLVSEYLESRRRDIDQLKGWLGEENYREVQQLGHRLKGSGSGYGFDEITAIGQNLEIAGREQKGEEIEESIQHLSHYLNSIVVKYVEE